MDNNIENKNNEKPIKLDINNSNYKCSVNFGFAFDTNVKQSDDKNTDKENCICYIIVLISTMIILLLLLCFLHINCCRCNGHKNFNKDNIPRCGNCR